MIDMRMPFTFGHSRAVASLTEAACKRAGLPAKDIRAAKWRAYTHDIGELAVPVSTWMRPGALTERERDAAHLHPYHGERALASLGGEEGKAIAALVLRHHERLDGTGYHRYAMAPDLSPAARILAAAEAFQTAREARPHRTALSDAAAASKLRDAVRDGKLCSEAVEAVLTVAGQPARRSTGERIAGLTPREIEVLRLIAAGHTAKEAARELEISPKTADNHIQSLYSKIGVKTRAGAALFALERGMMH
jgi:HD-GYP domain-containing protein (c-di-GMP phosphodiesterase class II)